MQYCNKTHELEYLDRQPLQPALVAGIAGTALALLISRGIRARAQNQKVNLKVFKIQF